MTWEDFDQLSSVYKTFGPYCSFPRQKWSALVNIRRKALLSSAGFRKRMTSPSPRGVYLPATHVYFCFDRPLWFVWWSDGLFRGLVLLFGSPLDWFNQEDVTASVWKRCFHVLPRSSLLANGESPFSGSYWVTSLEWPRMECPTAAPSDNFFKILAGIIENYPYGNVCLSNNSECLQQQQQLYFSTLHWFTWYKNGESIGCP